MTQSTEYEIWFYTEAGGNCPVDEFLDALPVKARAKVEKWLELLEEEGPDLPRPYADTLRDKIRELRIKWGHAQCRLLYFFMGKRIVITHGFLKKTDQVPHAEIERAINAMKDFVRRFERGELKA